MTVTLRDVAAHAGVSLQTVSNVTNERTARVGEDTRAKVRAAIAALNYRPNAAARHLRKMPTGVLALAIPDLVNPYFAEVSRVIVAEAAARGYIVLLDYTNWDREQELLVATGMRPHLIDGLILDAQRLTIADLTASPQVPIVLLGERLYGGPYDHVVIDNVAAARLATEHLIALDRRRIAVIGRQEHSTSNVSQMRLQGYLEALDAADRAADPRLQPSTGRWNHASGAAAMRALLALPEPPDAVFCCNDMLSIGAISVLHQAGLRIPEDVAVIGFDDVDDAQFTVPPLTSIAPDKATIGRLVVELLIQRITGARAGPPQRFDQAFRLVIRQSTVGADVPHAVTVPHTVMAPPTHPHVAEPA